MYITFTLTVSFCELGIFANNQSLKQEYDISKIGSITFSWKEVKCEQRSGVFIGYDIKLYFDEHVYTQRVAGSVTAFTIQPEKWPKFFFPRAISVAAISGFTVTHCPPVEISLLG